MMLLTVRAGGGDEGREDKLLRPSRYRSGLRRRSVVQGTGSVRGGCLLGTQAPAWFPSSLGRYKRSLAASHTR